MTQPFVCESKKIVWIRVPKTASTAVMKHVREKPWGWNSLGHPTHIRATSVAYDLVEKYRDYHWFGGVRHPFTWIPSLHRWLSLKNNDERLRWMKTYEIDNGWESFIQNIRWTPFEWLDHREIDVTPIPMEMSYLWKSIFDINLERHNVADRKKDFVVTPEIQQLIWDKFPREMKFYGDLEETCATTRT